VRELLDRQIEMNSAIADEGIARGYGSQVGRTLLEVFGDRAEIRAKAKAAAGSDARMGGCSLPVIINSGSGNQGMTVSLPVIEYAKELNASKEKLYRALLISNLVSIYQNTLLAPFLLSAGL
jgi:L-cysteine desulfidase